MIKHQISKGYLKVYFRANDQPYSISLDELGETVNRRIAECQTEIIIANNVSKWTLHLMTDKNLSLDFVRDFQKIVKEYCPDNNINWDVTEKAIAIYDEYRTLRSQIKPTSNNGFVSLMDYEIDAIIGIIKSLKEKYQIHESNTI